MLAYFYIYIINQEVDVVKQSSIVDPYSISTLVLCRMGLRYIYILFGFVIEGFVQDPFHLFLSCVCGMLVYRVEKSYVATSLAVCLLFK